MKKVKQHEQENIIRLKDQLLEYHNIKPEEYTKQAVKTKLKQDHMKAWKTNLSIDISSRKLKQTIK